MSARVIQDSDEEDDPLSCDAQPPPPSAIVAGRGGPAENNYNEEDGNGNCLSGVNGGTHEDQARDMIAKDGMSGTEEMGVNFDDFLQSQSQSQDANARGSMSSSQQRREERWIPSGGGSGITRGSGSIG